MNFLFSDDQLAIQELVEKIMADRITDEFWRNFGNNDAPLDDNIWKSLADAGLLGVALPEVYGGSEMSIVELCILLEAQGRFLVPIPLLSTLVAGALPIARFGNDVQKNTYLPEVIKGNMILSIAIGELGKPKDSIAFEAQCQEDLWVISGASEAVPYAEQAKAILVPARIENELALFIVNCDQDGVILDCQQTTNGQPVARLELDNLKLSKESLLIQGEEGWRWLEQNILVAVAAMQLGVAQEALRRTAEYSTERHQFGVPICNFQSVAHRAANAYIDVEAMRSTLWLAAWRLSENLPAEAEVRTAKWWASEGAHRVAHTAQHLHGGIGSDMDYPLHRYFLWAKQLEFTGGGARIQLLALGSFFNKLTNE